MVGQTLIVVQVIVYFLVQYPNPWTVPNFWETFWNESYNIYMVAALGVIGLMDLLYAVPGFPRWRMFVLFLMLVGFSAAIYVGGGWYVGTACGTVGIVVIGGTYRG